MVIKSLVAVLLVLEYALREMAGISCVGLTSLKDTGFSSGLSWATVLCGRHGTQITTAIAIIRSKRIMIFINE
jgi:hypothetical protein